MSRYLLCICIAAYESLKPEMRRAFQLKATGKSALNGHARLTVTLYIRKLIEI